MKKSAFSCTAITHGTSEWSADRKKNVQVDNANIISQLNNNITSSSVILHSYLVQTEGKEEFNRHFNDFLRRYMSFLSDFRGRLHIV